MIYDVRQVTSYAYASRVTYAHHVLRLTPIERPRQRVHAAVLDLVPTPIERRESQDFFGNHVTWVTIDEPHEELIIKVAARVSVDGIELPAVGSIRAWEAVREDALATRDLGPRSPVHFLFASRQVSLDQEIRAYALESFTPGRPILEAAIDLMRRIKSDFVYEVGVTTVSTTPPMSFALRRGVCQDFAHIMISGLRGLGLPAAYVSGYLRTARPGTPGLEGSDAMHAWVLVWCGEEIGWHGLDPTNAVTAASDHIVLAVGRDYADVAPIDGVIFAARGHKLGVAVAVTPVE
jgi:transglutaminase-like putative cysteine protease